jgi:flagellar basal body P-ring protein FlgI
MYDTEYVSLETNVYDAATGKIVWSGLTQTELGSKVQEQIEEFIEVISGAMIRDKLI